MGKTHLDDRLDERVARTMAERVVDASSLPLLTDEDLVAVRQLDRILRPKEERS